MIENSDLSKWDTVFTTSTKWLDVVITLRKQPVAREKVLKEKEIKKNLNRIEVPDWDLGQILVARLERAYGHLAMFFSEEKNTKVIGIKFKKAKVSKHMKFLRSSVFRIRKVWKENASEAWRRVLRVSTRIELDF